MPKPTIGRIVHYVSHGSADGVYPSVCRTAIVTVVTDESVGLAVLNPTGIFLNPSNPHHPGDPAEDAEGARCEHGDRAYPGGIWHWPERAPS